MPLGRQSAYRLQCAHTLHVTHEQCQAVDVSVSVAKAVTDSLPSGNTHLDTKGRERKQSKDMLNHCPALCPHVVNYNYAILISKHALHEWKPGSQLLSSGTGFRLRFRSNLSLTNSKHSPRGLLLPFVRFALKRRKMMNEIRRFSMTTSNPQSCSTGSLRPHPSSSSSSWSHLTPARTL